MFVLNLPFYLIIYTPKYYSILYYALSLIKVRGNFVHVDNTSCSAVNNIFEKRKCVCSLYIKTLTHAQFIVKRVEKNNYLFFFFFYS